MNVPPWLVILAVSCYLLANYSEMKRGYDMLSRDLGLHQITRFLN